MRPSRKGCTYPVKRLSVSQPSDPHVRYIPLTQGQIAVVDTDDYERLVAKHWQAQWDRHTQSFYARASHGGSLMHRFILGLTDSAIQCDHRNGNTLDNRKINLRPATNGQNRQNRGVSRNTTSGHAGVYWHKRDKRWGVYITADGKRIHCGYFKSKEEAIKNRESAELGLHGEFAYLARGGAVAPIKISRWTAPSAGRRTASHEPGANNASGYSGVEWNKATHKWRARIAVKRKRIFLGCFESRSDAIRARQDAERQYCGDFAPSHLKTSLHMIGGAA